jgi:hypothetical protein
MKRDIYASLGVKRRINAAGTLHWPANAVIPLTYHPLPDIV